MHYHSIVFSLAANHAHAFCVNSSLLSTFQVENRALRLREAMQQYQDESVAPSAASALRQTQQQPPQQQKQEQHQTQHYGALQSSNRLHTNVIEASDDPGGLQTRVGGLGLNGLAPQEETSRVIISSGLSASPNGAAGIGVGGGTGDWEYFDEAGYIRGGALRTGEDPYIRNRFNQEASDGLPSNREIPDTRHPM